MINFYKIQRLIDLSSIFSQIFTEQWAQTSQWEFMSKKRTRDCATTLFPSRMILRWPPFSRYYQAFLLMPSPHCPRLCLRFTQSTPNNLRRRIQRMQRVQLIIYSSSADVIEAFLRTRKTFVCWTITIIVCSFRSGSCVDPVCAWAVRYIGKYVVAALLFCLSLLYSECSTHHYCNDVDIHWFRQTIPFLFLNRHGILGNAMTVTLHPLIIFYLLQLGSLYQYIALLLIPIFVLNVIYAVITITTWIQWFRIPPRYRGIACSHLLRCRVCLSVS